MSKELEVARELVKMLEEKEKVNKVELATLNPGEVFKVGEHDFIVLEQTGGQTAVTSKDFMAEDVVFDNDSRDYKESKLKQLIESEIQQVIESAIGIENIVEHEVDLTSVDMQNEFGSCVCKVRPVTFDEARKYNDLIVNKDLPDWYWTCTPWSTKERGCEYSLAVVSPHGLIRLNVCNDCIGVRPFCILKSNIFVSRGEM